MEPKFFDRDISWLAFNERVLTEAAKNGLPLGERLNFLSIYSSNSDEFYRVRIPALMALHKIHKKNEAGNPLAYIEEIIQQQQMLFGEILGNLLPRLKEEFHIRLLYNEEIPGFLTEQIQPYFENKVRPLLKILALEDHPFFFPENNQCYLFVEYQQNQNSPKAILQVPSKILGRFFSTEVDGTQYILFLDDLIRENLSSIFPSAHDFRIYSFKVTRDAELDLEDEYEGDLVAKIEKQLLKRDMGYATRFLYDATLPENLSNILVSTMKLENAIRVAGGRYHNLKDLAKLPLRKDPGLFNTPWVPLKFSEKISTFQRMEKEDFLLNTPYQDYETVLNFFGDAATHPEVTEIYTTIYRMATDSRIAQTLISASKNGKKVTVFVELKARFDEENNIHWAKLMKAEGVKIIYSIPGLKVHSKIALVKRKTGDRLKYYGLLGTGNFNENTAKLYTDHILFTTNPEILRELELVFLFLEKRKKTQSNIYGLQFRKLLVSRFNMLPEFLSLIDEEIREPCKNPDQT